MGFPENLMTKDEEVQAHLHPHWITLVSATFWLIVICAATGAAVAFLPDGTAHGPLLIAVLALAIVLLCWLTLKPWLIWRTSHYVITNERVLIRRGILRHTGRDIALSRITDVGFVLTLLDRVVGAGTLTIQSASEQGQERLVNVPRAEQVQQLINHLIDQDSNARAQRGQGYQGRPPDGT
jgi:uncharacterized membrane protein YdbT with pleckstrin-like domain